MPDIFVTKFQHCSRFCLLAKVQLKAVVLYGRLVAGFQKPVSWWLLWIYNIDCITVSKEHVSKESNSL